MGHIDISWQINSTIVLRALDKLTRRGLYANFQAILRACARTPFSGP